MRVSLDAAGDPSGVVERVATGLKVRVHGAAEIARVREGTLRSSRATRTP